MSDSAKYGNPLMRSDIDFLISLPVWADESNHLAVVSLRDWTTVNLSSDGRAQIARNSAGNTLIATMIKHGSMFAEEDLDTAVEISAGCPNPDCEDGIIDREEEILTGKITDRPCPDCEREKTGSGYVPPEQEDATESGLPKRQRATGPGRRVDKSAGQRERPSQ